MVQNTRDPGSSRDGIVVGESNDVAVSRSQPSLHGVDLSGFIDRNEDMPHGNMSEDGQCRGVVMASYDNELVGWTGLGFQASETLCELSGTAVSRDDN
jgi:hypothetical protein